ncbi:hypothetical protein GAPWKB30_1913 [Gilliamella apicola]|nr:hypothetical protein [Gilliamella apicola]KDN09479.1 hypothetical protein GAPWKB30_1913 [Gilliamella apicola]
MNSIDIIKSYLAGSLSPQDFQNGMATHFQTKKLRGKCFLNSMGGK